MAPWPNKTRKYDKEFLYIGKHLQSKMQVFLKFLEELNEVVVNFQP